MSGTLAFLLASRSHHAWWIGDGAPVSLADPDSGASARANDLAFTRGRCWAGAAAPRAVLAGMAQEAGRVPPFGWGSFEAVAVRLPDGPLLLEGALGLMLRKGVADAQALGRRPERIVLHVHAAPQPDERQALERYLLDAVGCPVAIGETRELLAAFLRERRSAAPSRNHLAVAWLDDAVLVGVARAGSGTPEVAAVDAARGLETLRAELELAASPAAPPPAWSQARLWRELVDWHAAEAGKPPHEARLLEPHRVDRRFAPRAIEASLVTQALQRLFAPLEQALALLAEHARGNGELHLLADDARALGLQEAVRALARSFDLRFMPGRVEQLGLAALGRLDEAAPRAAPAAHGLLLRDHAGADKRFRLLVDESAPRPREGRLRLEGIPAEQAMVKLDVAVQPAGGLPQLTRRLYFEVGASHGMRRAYEVLLRVAPGEVAELRLRDPETDQDVRLAKSEIVSPRGHAVPGPERIEALALATG